MKKNKRQDIIVFSKQWFEYYQKPLLWFANTKWGRYVLRIHGERSDVGKNKIIKIEPHAITWKNNKGYKTEFRTHAKYAKRLYYAFKPLWHTIHAWDMLVANQLNYCLNLGFDTLTQYPNPGVTVDGRLARQPTSETFSTIRSASSATFVDYTSDGHMVYLHAHSSTSGRYINLGRSIFLFDTSTIGSSAVIQSGDFRFYSYSKTNDFSTTTAQSNLSLVSSNPSDTSTLTATDYSTLGTTELASNLSYSSLVTGYNTFALNSAGLLSISTSGITKLGIKAGFDVLNSEPTWAASRLYGVFGYYSDAVGITGDPRLVITYSVTPSAYYSSSNPYVDGNLKYKDVGGSWTAVSSGDLHFQTLTSTGATTISKSSKDPGTILEEVLDNFNDNGGTVTYSGASVDTTGTTVSYTFNTNTILEAINKCIELAPEGWYWYVDPATNLVHFHARSTTADHVFTLGKDIRNLKVEKRTENIINTVYFTGGPAPTDPLYLKFVNSDSVGLYGTKATRYTDERVTVTATATTIANSILNANSAPEIRISIEVLDSNVNPLGYDIDSIKVGDVINIKNITGENASSLWDVAVWDVDRWNYDIRNISTMYLQIMRIEYKPDYATLYCSTIPPDISKRIEDINRNLEQTQTSNNPTAPS